MDRPIIPVPEAIRPGQATTLLPEHLDRTMEAGRIVIPMEGITRDQPVQATAVDTIRIPAPRIVMAVTNRKDSDY